MTIVQTFYDSDPEREWQRLELPLCRLEFASTIRMIEKYFPETGRLIDVGSGPGRYSLELARRGYQVTLFDLSQKSLSLAQWRFDQEGLRAESFIQGDARDLKKRVNGVFDAGLFLGPLYHLKMKEERLEALANFFELLKPGGIGIVAYLNSWGLLRTGVSDFPAKFRLRDFIERMLSPMSFRPEELQGFTECHWSTPPAAIDEITNSGFSLISYFSAEGFLGGMRPQVEQLAADEPVAYQNLVEVAAATAELPQFRDLGDHLHLIIRKPSP